MLRHELTASAFGVVVMMNPVARPIPAMARAYRKQLFTSAMVNAPLLTYVQVMEGLNLNKASKIVIQN
jgi:hypothetical protein